MMECASLDLFLYCNIQSCPHQRMVFLFLADHLYRHLKVAVANLMAISLHCAEYILVLRCLVALDILWPSKNTRGDTRSFIAVQPDL